MNTDLFDFDDWGTFVRRGLLVVCALALGVFVVVTLAFWLHGVISEPRLGPNTAAIFAQPRATSEWLGFSLLPGAIFGLGAFVLGLGLLCLGALLTVLGQGLEARQVSGMSIEELSKQTRDAAEKAIYRDDAT